MLILMLLLSYRLFIMSKQREWLQYKAQSSFFNLLIDLEEFEFISDFLTLYCYLN